MIMAPERLGDKPIEKKYVEQMTAIMQTLDQFMNGDAKGAARKVGLVLLTFEYGDTSGRCNFMSNGADRRHLVTLFKEMIARFEGQPEMEGHA
jgi:hypothetical protein